MGFDVTTEAAADQQLANTINLSRYQKPLEVEDEEGRKGCFVFHRPNLGDELTVAALATYYLTLPAVTGPAAGTLPDLIPDSARAAAVMLAQLNVCCDMRPDWAPKDFRALCDGEMVSDLYNRFDEWVSSFRGRLSGAGGEVSSTTQSTDTGLAGGVAETPAH